MQHKNYTIFIVLVLEYRQGFHEEIAGSDRDSIEANFQ